MIVSDECRSRHRVVVGVQHPAGLLREVHARRAEDVDELVVAGADRLRGVDRWRRNDCDRRRSAQLVIVIAPEALVDGPRPAQVVHEVAFDRERALLEIVVMVRRELRRVARSLKGVEIVYHEGRAAPDAAEAALLRGHIEAVDAQLEAVLRLGPELGQGDMGLRRSIGSPVAAFLREIGGARGEHADNAAGRDHPQAGSSRRHESERAAVHALRAVLGRELDHGLRIGHQHRIFVGLRLAREHGILGRLGDGNDEVLPARIPGLAAKSVLLRRLGVEADVFRATERTVGCRLRGGCGRQGRARITDIVHANPPDLLTQAGRDSGSL